MEGWGDGSTLKVASRVAEQLEAAVFDPNMLPSALHRAGDLLGFDHFCLVHSNISELNVIATQASLDMFAAYEHGGWLQGDYRPEAVNRTPIGSLYSERLAVPEQKRLKSAVYQDFFLSHNIAHFAGWRVKIADETWIFSLARGDERGPLTEQVETEISATAPYVNRALMLARHTRHMRVQGMTDFAGRIGTPLLVLDSSGKVAAINAHAEALLGNDFGVREGRLWASHLGSQARLDALTQAARQRRGHATLNNFLVQRRDGSQAVLVRPMPVRGAGLDLLPGGRILVNLVPAKRRPCIAEGDLQTLFGLSSAEANVAALLATGLDAQEVADTRGVAVGTIRTQIRHLFEKMEVSRLGELIAVASSITETDTDPSSK